MTSITVLYGTTSANQAIPVLVDDAGQVVIDGGGTPGDSYWTLDGSTISTVYTVEGPSGNWSLGTSGVISASNNLSCGVNGSGTGSVINNAGRFTFGNDGAYDISSKSAAFFYKDSKGLIRQKTANEGALAIDETTSVYQFYYGAATQFRFTADGTIYCKTVIDGSGYDVQKIGIALSTIHDVVESVDDLQGLKNLLKLVLDNLKSDIPPDSPESE